MPAAPATISVPPFSVDRSSPVPLYFQVAQHLEDAIISGSIPPGTLFHNEIQLADELGLSRPTMRRAMQHLVEQGLIVRRRGIGTRVVQPKVRRQLELTSLYEDLAAAGQKPTTKVLSFDRIEADDDVAQHLGVKPGARVARLERLRSASGRPIARLTNYLPERFVDLQVADLAQNGLYELLRARAIVLHSATQTIGARSATAAEARELDEPRGAALLTMHRTAYDDHGVVVEYGTHLYAASRYSFEIDLLTP
jgi:GntR family transcriptional regulator